jgi:hypothetical protein
MKQIRIKTVVLFISCNCFVIAQNDSLLKQKNTYAYSKYTLFAFYDLVRFAGIGAEYRSPSFFGVEVKAGAVYSNGLALKLEDKLNPGNIDYSFNKGAGIMITPKQYFGNKKVFYIGLYASFYEYGFKNKVLSSGVMDNTQTTMKDSAGYIIYYAAPITQTVTAYETKHTQSYALGYTMGVSKCINRINYEFFVSAGFEKVYTTGSIYTTFSPNVPSIYFKPISLNGSGVIINALIGVKIGLGFNQQHLVDYRYYAKLYQNLIKEENKFVKEIDTPDYHYKDLKEEYYKYRYKLREELIEDCQSAKTDTALMQQHTIKAAKKIKEFVDDNFRGNP